MKLKKKHILKVNCCWELFSINGGGKGQAQEKRVAAQDQVHEQHDGARKFRQPVAVCAEPKTSKIWIKSHHSYSMHGHDS